MPQADPFIDLNGFHWQEIPPNARAPNGETPAFMKSHTTLPLRASLAGYSTFLWREPHTLCGLCLTCQMDELPGPGQQLPLAIRVLDIDAV
jgi:hypothetical protein